MKSTTTNTNQLKNDLKYRCIPTGINRLDQAIEGYQLPSFSIIGGASGSFKSRFAWTKAVNLSLCNQSVAFISSENSDNNIARELSAIRGGILTDSLVCPSGKEISIMKLQNFDFHVLCHPRMKAEDAILCVEYAARAGAGVIIFDSLNDILPEEELSNPAQLQLAKSILDELKELVTQHNIALICTARLRTGVGAQLPSTRHNLKWAGLLDYLADRVLMLESSGKKIPTGYNDDVYFPVNVQIEKNRFGLTSDLELKFDPNSALVYS